MADEGEPRPTRVLLVRHGESRSSVDRAIGGPRSCGGLSDLGRRQSAALADRLTRTGEAGDDVALYASHYRRAVETAELLAPALGDVEVRVDDRFGEHDPGPDCDGLTFDEFVERHGMPDWDADPYAVTFPGGETMAEMHYRVGVGLHEVTRQHAGGTIVVCCHGGVVDAAMRLALRAPIVGDFELYTTNTSITELLLVRAGRWRLQRYNDASHLADLPVATPRPHRE